MELNGYKAFHKGLTNRYGKQFEEGQTYENSESPVFGNHGRGYHFCERLEDTLRYFPNSEEEIDIAEVTALGDLADGEDEYDGYYDMYSTNKIRIDKVLTREEIIEMFLKMEPCSRVFRFINCFELDEAEIDSFYKVMVEDQPKTIKVYTEKGIEYEYVFIIDLIRKKLLQLKENIKNKKIIDINKQKLKTK